MDQPLQIDSISNDTMQALPNELLIGDKDSLLLLMNEHVGYVMNLPQNDIYFFFLLTLFIAYALARLFLGQLLTNTFSATIQYNKAIKIINDNSLLQKQIDQVLLGFYFFSFSFFLMQLQNITGWIPYDLHGIRLFLFNLIVLFFVFLLRYLLLNIVGIVFDQRKLFYEYLNHGYFYNKLAGIVLLPLNFLLIFTEGYIYEIIYYITLFALLLILLFKVLRGIIFSVKYSILNFYLFMYLCALEIVPLLLLYKWYFFIACST